MHVILMIFPSKDGCYRANPLLSVLGVGAITLFRLEIPPYPPIPFLEMLIFHTLPIIRVTYGGAPFVVSVYCAVSVTFPPFLSFSNVTCAQATSPFIQWYATQCI